MPSVQFIVHDGKPIFLMDFTSTMSTAQITRTVEEIKKTVELQRFHSLVALLDVTGTAIDRERTRIIQDMAAHNRPYIRFIAIVGLGFFRSVSFRIMLQLRGRKNHKVFGTREKALEWLAGLS